MPYKKKEIKKIHYAASEVAQILGVAVSNVRYWSDEFDSIKPYRNKRGVRYYSEVDIEEFKLIQDLVKRRGFTVAGAKKKLKENKEDEIDNQQIIQRLLSVRDMLNEIKKELN